MSLGASSYCVTRYHIPRSWDPIENHCADANSIPAFKAEGEGSRQEPSLALAFCALTNEWSTCWASFPPPSTGPKSATQCRYVSEDLRDLQDCVSQLTPLVVLPEKCKCCRNWVCAKKSGRPTTTVDFDVGGQLWWWWGGSSSFKPVSPAGSPLCLSTQSFICSTLIPWKGLRTCPHHCKASMWNETWKSAFLMGRPHGHGVEMAQRSIGSTLYVKVRQTWLKTKWDRGTQSFILRFLLWALWFHGVHYLFKFAIDKECAPKLSSVFDDSKTPQTIMCHLACSQSDWLCHRRVCTLNAPPCAQLSPTRVKIRKGKDEKLYHAPQIDWFRSLIHGN